MLRQYVFKVTKEQRVSVTAENKEDAYEKAEEESSMYPEDAEIVDVDLLDVYEEDEDAIYDDYRLGMFASDYADEYDEENEEEEDYDERAINKYFYGG